MHIEFISRGCAYNAPANDDNIVHGGESKRNGGIGEYGNMVFELQTSNSKPQTEKSIFAEQWQHPRI